MPNHVVTGDLEIVNANTGPVEVDGGSLSVYGSSIGNLTVTEGSAFIYNSTVTSIDIVSGSVRFVGCRTGAVTLAADTGNSLVGTDLDCEGLTLTGGGAFMDVEINGLIMPRERLISTGTFYEWSIRNAVIGQKFSSTTFASGGLIDITDLGSFDLQATIYRAYRSAVRLEDCVAGKVDVIAIDPGVQADNAHDAIDLVGACGELALFGAVYGAVNASQNPRYAIAAAAGTTAPVDVFMSLAGYQTGAVNDASGNVVVH